ncbi:Type 1 glutamine amidotransferase-like domain-containing protein [Exiguobacterium antarcticum]|uniref:Type 1 glutamine amidotransferase-like domain-containing protein n=1 Tax=Exiguobacterium antarcticum TaxID=132920 RepID=A0ABT6R604_9BACL|nr:Type 1 glutamine amidotransferase-like domain-containing protein [Exiguobacterium antarcticum]AFS69445.1 peptidase S51 dipeptidase E [Exiguobacterium antarcticum B7]MDI3236389.1 Type 1 glutamine amidotransferase-like domain-containing protein [Exiguobacterium antarcticum]
MRDQQLFLFGGGPPFTPSLCKTFVSCLNGTGPVALLYVPRPGSSWADYAPIYTDALAIFGITTFFHLPLSDSPTAEQLEQLAGSAGIIISGGETERYQQFIVETPIGALIQERFQHGVPVAGFSAGALLTPEECRIPAIDQRNGQALVLKGLGLLPDSVISVHYDTWQEETNLRQAFLSTSSTFGYGLPEQTGIHLKNGQLMQQEGPEAVLLRQKEEMT